MTNDTSPPDLRAAMPKTAEWVGRMRAELGRAHVNDCIRRALAGEAGRFYAIEQGQVLGTPFPPTHPIYPDQQVAVQLGATFAGFIRTPEAADGTN